MMKCILRILLCMFNLLILVLSQTSCSKIDNQEFPQGDVKIVISNGPGGGNDLTLNALIPGLQRELKTNVFMENRLNSNGLAAFKDVANAKPDGHKLYFSSQTVLLMKHVGYSEADVSRLAPVAQVVEDAAVIYVRGDSKYNTLADLMDHINDRSHKLKIAIGGIGGLWHLSGVMFAKAAGVDFQYVSYPVSSYDMLTALVNGDVDISINGPSEARPFQKEDKVRALAVLNEKRYPTIPDVPTCIELGIDLDVPIWRGVFTTAGTDEKIIKALSDAVKAATESEEFKKYAEVGMPVKFRDYKEFSQFISNEKEKYDRIMEEINQNSR